MMDKAVRQQIENDIKNNKIMLYMKGTPDFPACGFSAQIVNVLNEYGISFRFFDILKDNDLREGIKEYSDWPTIPQLYVNGQFIGGCDIVTEMHNNGELSKVLGQN